MYLTLSIFREKNNSFSGFIQPSIFENHKTFEIYFTIFLQHVKITVFYEIKVKTSLAKEYTANLLAK